jgi:hypothetical protein
MQQPQQRQQPQQQRPGQGSVFHELQPVQQAAQQARVQPQPVQVPSARQQQQQQQQQRQQKQAQQQEQQRPRPAPVARPPPPPQPVQCEDDDEDDYDDEDGEEREEGGGLSHLSDKRFADMASKGLISGLTAKAILEPPMGYEYLTVVQAATLEHLLTGKDWYASLTA